jgi:hypothetical protein
MTTAILANTQECLLFLLPVCEPPFFPVKLTDGYLLVLKVHRMYLSTNYNQNPQALCPSNGFFPQLKKIV